MADDDPAVPPPRASSPGVTPASLSALLERRLPGYRRLVSPPAVDEAALEFPADVLEADPAAALQVARQLVPGPTKRLRI